MIKDSEIMNEISKMLVESGYIDEVIIGDYDLTNLVAGKTIAIITPIEGEFKENMKINSFGVIVLTRNLLHNYTEALLNLCDKVDEIIDMLHNIRINTQNGLAQIKVMSKAFEHYPTNDGNESFIYAAGLINLHVYSQIN